MMVSDLSVCLPACLSVCLSACLPARPSVSVFLLGVAGLCVLCTSVVKRSKVSGMVVQCWPCDCR